MERNFDGGSKMKVLLFLRKIKQKIDEVGLLNTAVGVFKRVFLYRILYLFFHFDKWHVIGVYNITPYKQEVVKLANEIKPKSAIEIGCGLGEIISRINANKKVGLDIDKRVIDACRFLKYLRGDSTNYFVGSIEYLNDEEPFDMLIMVNWLHGVSEQELIKYSEIFKDKAVNIIVDEIDKSISGYEYYHDYDRILGKYYKCVKTSQLIGPRRIKLYTLLNKVNETQLSFYGEYHES